MKKSHLFFAGILAVIFLLVAFYIPALTRYHNLKLQEEEMDVKIRDLDQKIKGLVEERDLLKNDRDYLEKIIRKELGLVKPGEIIYKFITEPKKKETKKIDHSVSEEMASGVSGSRPVVVPELTRAVLKPESKLTGAASKIKIHD